MLKFVKNRFRKRNKSALKGTPGENIRDAIIRAGLKAAEESGYAAGNTTEKLVNIASQLGNGADLGVQLTSGSESASALGRIVFKATKDAVRGDTLCTGLCAVSATCETIALSCSTIKIIPFRGKIYVFTKIVSKGCMTYRNLCAGEDC